MFISDLYTGSISDKDISKHSGILELLEKGDDCMADMGFNIKDLLEPIGVVALNIPPFLSHKAQFNEEQVGVKRATSRIEMYKITANSVPLSLARVFKNQIWTVSCMLFLFQSPIIDHEYGED